MTTRRILATAASFIALAGAANAQGLEFGNGFTLSGDIKLQHEHIAGNGAQTVIAPDVTLGWTAAGSQFGAEISFDGIQSDMGGSALQNVWAAGVINFDFGTVKIGGARPVIETLKPLQNFGSSLALNEEASYFTGGSFISALAKSKGGIVPGVSFEGQAQDLKYGISVHNLHNNAWANAGAKDTTSVEAVAVQDVGFGSYYGAFQYADAKVGHAYSAELGATYDADLINLGLKIGREKIALTGLGQTATFAGLSAGYEVMPALELKAEMLYVNPHNQKSGKLYSVSANYDVTENVYLNGGYTGSERSDIERYDLTVGLKF